MLDPRRGGMSGYATGNLLVSRLSRIRAGLRSFARRRAQLALALRVTTAALAALALAQYLHLPLPLWAVLTAVIVTQMSVGRSLKATLDYLVGTLSGAIYGGAIGVLVRHDSELALLGVLALALAPLALIATMKPSLSVAPITAIIVLLVPTITHASPYVSALDRIYEVPIARSRVPPRVRCIRWRGRWKTCLPVASRAST
jgi:uncharacterized membrane protein YccC